MWVVRYFADFVPESPVEGKDAKGAKKSVEEPYREAGPEEDVPFAIEDFHVTGKLSLADWIGDKWGALLVHCNEDEDG